ncbi:MAG: hypothetical protein EOO56_18875 [Hymenobacter sp.]|nr:MAG: hypothetical protein EOO56_18875 [Hymenobacter sp.]
MTPFCRVSRLPAAIFSLALCLGVAGVGATVRPASAKRAGTAPNTLSATEKQQGWHLLFDGKTPTGWHSAKGPAFPARGWQIADGTLTVLPSEGKEAAPSPTS